jgi:hypothetical protein
VSGAPLPVQVFVFVFFFNPFLPHYVQVYFHGGSFTSGVEFIYTGDILTGNDIIFVSAAYRYEVFYFHFILCLCNFQFLVFSLFFNF